MSRARNLNGNINSKRLNIRQKQSGQWTSKKSIAKNSLSDIPISERLKFLYLVFLS